MCVCVCCPLSHISWISPALCPLLLETCCPALSHSQQEALPTAPERWRLLTVAAWFFGFIPCPGSPFFPFGASSPWFLACLQQVPGERQPCRLSSPSPAREKDVNPQLSQCLAPEMKMFLSAAVPILFGGEHHTECVSVSS